MWGGSGKPGVQVGAVRGRRGSNFFFSSRAGAPVALYGRVLASGALTAYVPRSYAALTRKPCAPQKKIRHGLEHVAGGVAAAAHAGACSA